GAVAWVAAAAGLAPPGTSRPSRAETPAASAPTTRITVTGITDHTAKRCIFNRALQLSREKVPMPVLMATALTDGATSTPAAISGVIESGPSRSSDEHPTRRRPRIRAIRLHPPTGNGLAGRSDSWRS